MNQTQPYSLLGALQGGFLQPQSRTGGLLGGVYPGGQPFQSPLSNYEQMAAPYSQWAAQQLQAVSPQMQVPDHNALLMQQRQAQMMEQMQRQQQMQRSMMTHNAGGDN